ncbi:response regulator [Leptolyngbya sp. FACHB-261]|uniref:response regulator n=1 Tax=Leptolyngbya sp. FACHB-261 TaxID=2692806 RepID=UPI00168460A4|nr:response regulator [Leptolyngbya sp. FACHB-261]MBD2101186.1 response regulator [Leptolyngbya sp. FACHB-261]
MSFERKTVLVVEDRSDFSGLIQYAFQEIDLEVSLQIVHDGKEAVYYLRGQQPYESRQEYPLPAMILTNKDMPGMTGLQLVAWVKKQPTLSHIPVVMMTAASEPEERRKAKDLGISFYFVKPADFDDLVNTVRMLTSELIPGDQQ